MLSGSVGAKKKIERRGKALESKRESRERRWEPSLPQGYLKILHWGHLIEPFVIEASFHDTLCLQSMETLYMWVDECREYRVDVLPPRCLPSLIEKKVWYVLLSLRNVISISCLGHSMDSSPALAFSCASFHTWTETSWTLPLKRYVVWCTLYSSIRLVWKLNRLYLGSINWLRARIDCLLNVANHVWKQPQ